MVTSSSPGKGFNLQSSHILMKRRVQILYCNPWLAKMVQQEHLAARWSILESNKEENQHI